MLKFTLYIFEKFWVVENSFTIATKLNKINTKEKPKKSISTFDFTSLHTTMPHNLLSQSRDGVSKKIYLLNMKRLWKKILRKENFY